MGGMSFGSMLDPLQQPSWNDSVVPPMRPPQAIVTPATVAPTSNVNPNPQAITGWQAFLDKVAGDKNLQRTLLQTGAALLQPRRGGQTQAGAIGAAIAGGANFYDQLNTQDQNQARLDQEMALRERSTAAQERNAATSETSAASDAAYRQKALDQRAAEAPTAQERAAELRKTEAEIRHLNAQAATAGVSQSVGADESLARLYAAALRDKNPALSESDAILQSIREIKTLGKNRKTPAEFKAGLMQAFAPSMALLKPEERAQMEQTISTLTDQYVQELNPQGAAQGSPAPQVSDEQQAGDAAWAREIAANPAVDKMKLAAHIKKYAPGWNPPADSGTVQR